MRPSTFSRVVLLGALAVLAAPRDAAAQVKVSMRANASQVSVANAFQVTVTVEGVSNLLECPPLEGEGFKVIHCSIGQSRSSSLIGRRRQQNIITTFTYRMQPTRTGTIEIAPVTIEVGGKTHRSPQGLTIEAQPIQPQDDFVLELEGPARPVYVDQEFAVRLKVFARRLSGRYRDADPFTDQGEDLTWPHLTISWLAGEDGFLSQKFEEYARALLAEDGAGFRINNYTTQSRRSFFPSDAPARFRFERSEATRKGSDGREYPCFVYSIEKRFQPTQAGTHLFSSVIARGHVIVDQSGQPRAKEFIAESQPLEVVVKAPPEEGKPPFFTGAIGKWTVTAGVKPAKVWVGQPLTLTVTVQGDGRLEEVGPPPMAVQEGFDAQFRIHEEPQAGVADPKTRSKTFTYGIRPKTAELTAVPPIAFAYFDVEAEKYVTVKTQPLPIQVEQGRSTGGEFFEPSRIDREKSQVQVVESMRYPIYEHPDALLAARPVAAFGRLELGLIIAPPIVSLAVIGLVTRHRRRHADPAALRARRAYRNALARFAEARDALKAGDTSGVHGSLARAVATLIGDRLGISASGMTVADAREGLRAAGIGEELAHDAIDVFERADMARYGSANEDPAALAARIESGRRLLADLSQALIKMGGKRQA